MSEGDRKRIYLRCKRISDVVCAMAGLIVASPLILVLAMLVKLQSPGPAVYSQWRVGYRGRRFRIYKLRSMIENAELGTPMLCDADDERVTPIGRFMRRYHLDELPNMWNVLIGDMSIVGPRPEREYFIDKIKELSPEYDLIMQVRPGMTSWGMVKYGYATDVGQMVERLRYDILYIRKLSPALDMKIILHTIRMLGKGRGI
ncbi:MAG: sugar transferase [Duncaniella sp.]|nr:sugar transferase [Duncaniella sp.]MDE7146209.1 sugar transferase [Duncaniella sp.]